MSRRLTLLPVHGFRHDRCNLTIASVPFQHLGGDEGSNCHRCYREGRIQPNQHGHYIIRHTALVQRASLKPPFFSLNRKEPYLDIPR